MGRPVDEEHVFDSDDELRDQSIDQSTDQTIVLLSDSEDDDSETEHDHLVVHSNEQPVSFSQSIKQSISKSIPSNRLYQLVVFLIAIGLLYTAYQPLKQSIDLPSWERLVTLVPSFQSNNSVLYDQSNGSPHGQTISQTVREKLLSSLVCPTMAVDIRVTPDQSVNRSISYLNQFKIEGIYTFDELTSTNQSIDQADNHSTFPFSWLQSNPSINQTLRFTVMPEDPGYWFKVRLNGVRFDRTKSLTNHSTQPSIKPVPTPGTKLSGSMELNALDDLSIILQRVRDTTGEEMDWSDIRGPIWPYHEYDSPVEQLNDQVYWVFGEPELIWQPCDQNQLPVFRTAHNAPVSPYSNALIDQASSSSTKPNLRILMLSISTNCARGDRLRDSEYSEYLAIKQAYARKHGFDCLTVCRKFNDNVQVIQYDKINVIVDVFREHASFLRASDYSQDEFVEYDYIFWNDWDTVIMNGTTRLDQLIPASLPDQVFTDHHFAINDGAFFLRLTPRSWRFLQIWQTESYKYRDFAWADNGSWNHLLLTYLDRDPVYDTDNETTACERQNNGPPYEILICTHLRWMEDAYEYRYMHRFSQFLVGIPPMAGFNNHQRNSEMPKWGWMTSVQFHPGKGMFMDHNKDWTSMGFETRRINEWKLVDEDWEVDSIAFNAR